MKTAVGIDPSWVLTHPTGISIMEDAGDGWTVTSTTAAIMDIDAIRAGFPTPSNQPVAGAVGTPLWIPNETGIRECDHQVVSRYIDRKIGVYPCNSVIAARRGWKTIDIRVALEDAGYVEAPAAAPAVYFETYPHPALVNLLDLPSRPEYKKGRIADRHRGLQRLGRHLHDLATTRGIRFADDRTRRATIPTDLEALGGRDLKLVEDRLDAFVCAVIAADWLDFGRDGNEIIGAPGQGLMIFPDARASD
jgi:predicted RNase H-like nuclease